MAVNIIKRTWHQNQMVKIEPLNGFAFQAESGGHTFQISGVDDSGNAVPISGTIAGVFLRPDNADVALTGSASGGVASVTLTAECYAVPGRFLLTVYATSGSNKGTIYAAMGTVSRTSSGAVSPAAASDVVDLVNRINAATATIPASYTTLLNAVATDYSPDATYPKVGTFVWYSGKLYRSKVPITTAETWTAAHWNQVVLSDALNQDITDLKSAIDTITGNEVIQFTQGKFIRDNYSLGTVIDYLNPLIGAATNFCAVADAVAGDVFTINGTGGNQGRLWAFVDSSKKLLSVADANASADNIVLTAPENSDKLILNVNGAHDVSCKGYMLFFRTDNIEKAIENTALNSEDLWLSRYGISGTGEFLTASGGIALRNEIKLDDIEYFTVSGLPNNASGHYVVYDSSGAYLDQRSYLSNHRYYAENIKRLFTGAFSLRFDMRGVDADTLKHDLIRIQYKTNETTKFVMHETLPFEELNKGDFVNGAYSSQQISTRTDMICTRFLRKVLKGDYVKYTSENLYIAIGMYVGSSMAIVNATGWIEPSQTEKEYVCNQDGWLVVFMKKSSGDISPSEYDADIKIYNTINSRAISGGIIKRIIDPNSKTVAFLGDSLTAGVGTNYIYHMYLADRFGWHCKNYGYGGSGYVISYSGTGGKMATGQEGMGYAITSSNKFEPNDFYTRIQTITTDIDALVIFGGTNDWGYNASMSDFNTALDNVYSYAQTTFGMKPIIVMLPCHRLDDDTQNTEGNTLQDYIDAIVAKCREYGIICIDTLAESGLNPSNNTNKTDFFTRDDNGNIDGVHPNRYAHKMISNLVAPVIMNKLY